MHSTYLNYWEYRQDKTTRLIQWQDDDDDDDEEEKANDSNQHFFLLFLSLI